MSTEKLAALDPEPETDSIPTPVIVDDKKKVKDTEEKKDDNDVKDLKDENNGKDKEDEKIKKSTEDSKDDVKSTEQKPITLESNIKETKETDDNPPPIPQRPSKSKTLTQTDLTISQLVDMFPDLDLKYIKMSLIASEGRLEPASNALLFLSDPNSNIEIPTYNNNITNRYNNNNNNNNIEETDEELARRLAKAYERGSKRASSSSSKKVLSNQPNHQYHRSPSKDEYRNNYNNLNNSYNDYNGDDDDDLYNTITKNVNDAKQIVGGWLGNVTKKIQNSIDSYNDDDEFDENYNDDYGTYNKNSNNSRRSRYNPEEFNHYDGYDTKPLPKRNPYQQPQSVQRGYYTQNEYVSTDKNNINQNKINNISRNNNNNKITINNDDEDEDAPKLPARRIQSKQINQNIKKQQNNLYPAVAGNSLSDIENSGKITVSNNSDDNIETKAEAEVIKSENVNNNQSKPNPIEKDDLYTSNNVSIQMNKKSNPTTATTETNSTSISISKPPSPSKNWTPLKSIDPEPSNDAFLVEDDSDDDDTK